MAAKNLKQARVKRGLTQDEAAKLLGVSDGAYKNYEQGKREPKYELLLKIADLFHVTTDYLLGREAKEETALDSLSYEFDMTLLEKKIVEKYLSLPKEQREDVMDFVVKTVDEVHAETVARNAKAAAETDTPEKGESPPELDIKAAVKAAWEQSGRIAETIKSRNKV